MRVACIPSMALRIALSGRYRVRLSQRGRLNKLLPRNNLKTARPREGWAELWHRKMATNQNGSTLSGPESPTLPKEV